MGFQEIIYKKKDNEERQLMGLSFQVALAPLAYLWLELEKNGMEMVGIRVSRNAAFPSGIYEYSNEGRLQTRRNINFQWESSRDRANIKVDSIDNDWYLFVDGKLVGSVKKKGRTKGEFGFRGSAHRRWVFLTDIKMSFRNPQQPGVTWEEHESFSSRDMQFRIFPWILLLVGLILSVRILRQLVLVRYLSEAMTARFMLIDNCCLAILLAVGFLLPRFESGVVLPLCLLGSELISLTLFAYFYSKRETSNKNRFSFIPVVYGILLLGVTGWAVAQHGDWLWRSQTVSKKELRHVHPDIFKVIPNQKSTSNPFVLSAPVEIVPGSPLFLPNVFAAQTIDVDFRLPENSTLDIVFQQQSFLTRGDPNGEALPLQRRLLRLSNRKDVISGLSASTTVRPKPLLIINGQLNSEATNRLKIEALSNGIGVTLNGEYTHYDQFKTLGVGETGFLVYENKVILEKLKVAPGSSRLQTGNWFVLSAYFWPLIIGVVIWSFFRLSAGISFWTTLNLVNCALFPVFIYLAGTLFVTTSDLIFMDDQKMKWLLIFLIAGSLSLLKIFIVHKSSLSSPALYSNLMLVLPLLLFVSYVWINIIPVSHPLRLKFSDAIAPGDIAQLGASLHGPWYSSNRTIGANTWIWKQKFGGESTTIAKEKDKIRIFLLGGSQAWGSGAADSRHTYSELLEKLLTERGYPVEVYNAGVNAAGISSIMRTAKDLLPQFKADIVIIGAGINDSGAMLMTPNQKQTQKYLQKLLTEFSDFVEYFKSRNIGLILNLETMSAETYNVFAPEKELYDGLEAIAEKSGVQVVRPAKVTEKLEKDHILWWDVAHLTPFGQQIMAEILLEPSQNLVRRKMKEIKE